MPIADRVRRAAQVLWRVPCKLMVATILICAATREWYPFSPFPMYTTFGPTTWYVCLTDGSGRPLPTDPYLGLQARPLRRMFETRVLTRTAQGAPLPDAESAAAAEVLRFVLREARPRSDAPPLPNRIALRRTRTRIDGGRIERADDTLGELAPP
jgi:hypothetical protein